MPEGDGTIPETPNTVFELPNGPITVSKADGEAIRDALAARIEGSDVEDRDMLLGRTRGRYVKPQADLMVIGGWRLTMQGDELQLMFRFGTGAPQAYIASVEKTANGWQVSEVERLYIHPRR